MKPLKAGAPLFVTGLGLVVAACGVAAPSGVEIPSIDPSPIQTAAAPATASPTPTSPETVRPTLTATPTSTTTPEPFPTEAFTDVGEGGVSKNVAAQFQAALNDMAAGGGMAATVMTAKGTWSGAAGKADGVHDVMVESQFGIGSVTKSVIAAQVMQLVESGELSLDDPATDHLPADFAFDTNGATIRHLLDMRSGIPDWYGEAMEAEVAKNRTRVWKPADVLALVGPARRPAGSLFEYADTNYNLLGLVIEHVRQRPLVAVLRDGVLRVEGTERLIYQPDEAPSDPMAMPLGESHDALQKGGGYLPSLSDASSAGPAGSIASDSISLARWWRAFCAGEIVSEASLIEMSAFVGGPDGYGFGLFNVADPWGFGVGHTGGNFGYSSWAGCMPGGHGVVVVVLTNFSVDDLGGLPRPLVLTAQEVSNGR
jgi:D-alanyl-D-alanine carboxypeptidase